MSTVKNFSLILLCGLSLIGSQARETATPAETVATDTSAVTTATGPVLSTDTAIAAPSNRVSVQLVDYEIHMPTSIPAGTTTFDVENTGKRKHSIEIEGNGIEVELEPVLAPGGKGSLTVELQPGTYKVYCPVGDHEKKHGMVTSLTVS
jgi:uncharacterized cupredoxin-like copper-binding protein